MASCGTTLPASWYTSEAIYTLEKRGVFMTSWILLGAVTRWPDTNEDYHGEMVQIEYVVRRSSPDWKTIKVCTQDGADIRTHLTSNGLLFITFSDETVPFDEFFPGLTELISRVDFTELPIRRPLRYPVEYNWKTMIDGYQECLHCAYAHPEFAKRYLPQTYKVINHHNYSRHITSAEDAMQSDDDGFFIYLFPNSTLSVYGGGMTSWRVCPSADPTRAVMDFDYYHKSPLGAPDFEEFFHFTRHVAMEDIQLCARAQENLNTGIYSVGLLNPAKENGVAYYQGRVLTMCSDQYDKEKDMKARGAVVATP